MKKFNVIDLFCGCGGFSKGFEEAGFNICFGNICSTHSPISIIPTAYTILIFIVLIILSLFLAP